MEYLFYNKKQRRLISRLHNLRQRLRLSSGEVAVERVRREIAVLEKELANICRGF